MNTTAVFSSVPSDQFRSRNDPPMEQEKQLCCLLLLFADDACVLDLLVNQKHPITKVLTGTFESKTLINHVNNFKHN